MRVYSVNYQNVPALRAETDRVIAVYLPENGGRLQSLRMKGIRRELLCQDPCPNFFPQTEFGSYIAGNVSGGDEMFPTIDPVSESGGSREGRLYPDHGIVARIPHRFSLNGGTLTLSCGGTDLGFTYKKEIHETEDGFLQEDFQIKNQSEKPFPCYWAYHLMLAGVAGARVETTYEKGAPVGFCFDTRNTFARPGAVLPETGAMRTQRPYAADGPAYKFFFKDPMPEGMIRYAVPGESEALTLRFQGTKLPFVGVWVNNGTFKGLYNTALEIATGPFDSPLAAEREGFGLEIPGKGTLEFSVRFTAEAIKR